MSESNKFTPGPWITESSDSNGIACVATADNLLEICEVWGSSENGISVDDESMANATLIAAAPDLLEALENLLWHAEVLEEFIESERGRGRNADQLYADGEMHNYMVEAKASILKARGKQ